MGRQRGSGGHDGSRAAILGLSLLATLSSVPLCAGQEDGNLPPVGEDVLSAVRECMAKSPLPWPNAWQHEYVDTIREVIGANQDTPQYAARLEILRKGFPPYWQSQKKNRERSAFEVHCAAIRWYVESLMHTEFPGPEQRRKLRDQYSDLVEHGVTSLLTQFPFLDPNMVQKAKADYLAQAYRDIEAPLLPIFQHPFSEQQVGQLNEHWHGLRYARVDLWRQLGGGRNQSGVKADVPAGKTHPDYLLAQRSLDQLRGQLWIVVAGPRPDYYRDAVAQEIEAQKERVRLRSEARRQEERLGRAVLQTEYLSFLFAALLETADIQRSPVEGSSAQRNDE
jgi:hypothetical protein